MVIQEEVGEEEAEGHQVLKMKSLTATLVLEGNNSKVDDDIESRGQIIQERACRRVEPLPRLVIAPVLVAITF